MRARRGVWSEWSEPSAPICDSDIRRWAIAVYWPEAPPRLYWDEAYARGTRWGGIVAPVEFNPFAWGVREEAERVGPRPRRRRVNGGCRLQFAAIMRPGDRIRRRSRLEDWEIKRSREGEMLLVRFTHEWRNQRDELVRHAVYTLIHL
jgi:hypothetical protein